MSPSLTVTLQLALQGYPEDKIPMKKVSLSPTLPEPSTHPEIITDSNLSLEPTVHLSLQRRRKKDKVKRQPHLEYRCKETPRREMDVPSLSPSGCRITTKRGICGATVELGTSYLGSTSIAHKSTSHLQFPVSSIMVVVGG